MVKIWLSKPLQATRRSAVMSNTIWPDEKMDDVWVGVVYGNSEWLASSQLQSCLWRWNIITKQIQTTPYKILLSPSVPPRGSLLRVHRKTWKRMTKRLTVRATVVVVRIMTDHKTLYSRVILLGTDLPVAHAGPSRSTNDKLEHEGVCIANLRAQVKSMTVSCQKDTSMLHQEVCLTLFLSLQRLISSMY